MIIRPYDSKRRERRKSNSNIKEIVEPLSARARADTQRNMKEIARPLATTERSRAPKSHGGDRWMPHNNNNNNNNNKERGGPRSSEGSGGPLTARGRRGGDPKRHEGDSRTPGVKRAKVRPKKTWTKSLDP